MGMVIASLSSLFDPEIPDLLKGTVNAPILFPYHAQTMGPRF